MAHNLEITGKGAAMAYRGATGKPWHGLGVEVGDKATPLEIMDAAQLNWTVSKHDTFIEGDFGNGLEKIQTNVQALVRDSDGKIFDTVGPDWNPVQNSEAFDFFVDFVEKGDMIMDTAGALKDGRIVWAMASLKEGFTVFGNDEVKGYLLFTNPHMYGKSIDVRFCATRVVCNNTLTMALAERGRNAVKINHRSTFDAERVKSILGLSHEKMDNFKDAAEFIGSKNFKSNDLTKYFGEIFGVSEVEGKDLSRTAEMVMGLVETQPGAEYASGTFWQAFNAVTYAADHVLGRSNDTRLESAWFGKNANVKQKALALAIEMAKVA